MDNVIFDASSPRLRDVIDEYQRICPLTAVGADLDPDDIRFNRWENQSTDCRKHDADGYIASPWEGASDQRVYLVDEVINEQVALCVTAFWRAMLRAEGTEAGDIGKGAPVTRALQWFINNRQKQELMREVELAAQYIAHYGWCALHPTWHRRLGLKRHTIALDELPEQYQALVLDPTLRTMAEEAFQASYEQYVTTNLSGLVKPGEVPRLTRKVVTRALDELRDTGQTQVPIPHVAENRPSITALKPFTEVLISADVGDAQRCTVFTRQFLTEQELYEKVMLDGWDEEWVKRAAEHKGKYSTWTLTERGVPTNLASFSMLDTGNPTQIEVVTAYQRRFDEDMIPGIYCTVFHPMVGAANTSGDEDLVASHGLLDYAHGAMPFVVGVREWVDRSILASRGVPQVAYPSQRVIKVGEDSLIDRSSIEVVPPVLVPQRYMNQDYPMAPRGKIPFVPGAGMPTPYPVGGSPAVSVDVMHREERWVAKYFGQLHPEVPVPSSQVKQQLLVDKFLALWHGALQQEMQLILQYTSDEEFLRITGLPKPVKSDPGEIANEYDLMLNFDARTTDMDHVVKELEVIQTAILPADAAGVIDRAKLVQLALAAVNPMLARMLVSDQAAASQKLYKDVEAQLNSMLLGNPPAFTEQDPAAGRKLQYAQQIVASNPLMQEAAKTNPTFQENLRSYAKNLMFSVTEEQNKVTGRIGVKPNEVPV